jgi:hypothetical protein
MDAMPYHRLHTQIPQLLADRLFAEADARGESVGKTLTTILGERFRVPADQLPKRKRAGRKPKDSAT